MRFNLSVTDSLYCLATLALGFAGLKYPLIKRIAAYGGAILTMIHLCSLAGAAAGSIFNKSPNNLTPMLGFFGGFAIGIVAGIALGRVAETNMWLYWFFVLFVAFFVSWVKLM